MKKSISRCLGITRNLHRCKRARNEWSLFCSEHSRQWLVWVSFIIFTVMAGTIQIVQAIYIDRPSANIASHTLSDKTLHASVLIVYYNRDDMSDYKYCIMRNQQFTPSARKGYYNLIEQIYTSCAVRGCCTETPPNYDVFQLYDNQRKLYIDRDNYNSIINNDNDGNFNLFLLDKRWADKEQWIGKGSLESLYDLLVDKKKHGFLPFEVKEKYTIFNMVLLYKDTRTGKANNCFLFIDKQHRLTMPYMPEDSMLDSLVASCPGLSTTEKRSKIYFSGKRALSSKDNCDGLLVYYGDIKPADFSARSFEEYWSRKIETTGGANNTK